MIGFGCCFQSILLANLTEYCENGAARSEQLVKLPNWHLVHYGVNLEPFVLREWKNAFQFLFF